VCVPKALPSAAARVARGCGVANTGSTPQRALRLHRDRRGLIWPGAASNFRGPTDSFRNPIRRSVMQNTRAFAMSVPRIVATWLATACALGAVSEAHAVETYHGRLDLVQSAGEIGPRFYVAARGLSIYAFNRSADEKLLLEAFFRKANVTLYYELIACPDAIAGTCGQSVFVSVHFTGF
jgi:hypothetical protein